MNRRSGEFSQDIYHKIYRLMKRNVGVPQIAAALDLPTDAVQSIASRFRARKASRALRGQTSPVNRDSDDATYLDIIFLPKSRYAIMDIAGMLTESHAGEFGKELNKALSSTWKTIAFRMFDVRKIDESGIKALAQFHTDFFAKGRYMAVLDPSSAAETAIEGNELTRKIAVFGTERAFEDSALRNDTRGPS